ncbi:MAG: choice-of-anchor B family protein [Chitinophagaceae bacterium]
MRWQIHYLLLLTLLGAIPLQAQVSKNVTLLCNWQDTTDAPALPGGQHWNDVWGFVANGREYAVIGGTKGAHVIDVSSCTERAFLPGPSIGAVHRDYKTYGHYLYAVADEGVSALQVYDFNYLPDSLHLVFQSDPWKLANAHNIFIDTAKAKLYLASPTTLGLGKSRLQIYSLADPEDPSFLYTLNSFEYTHDMYARNDTVWCSDGNGGYLVLDMSDPPNYIILGGLSFYPYQGYNHSSWIGYDNIGVMADETFGMPVKVIDCRNMKNIKVLSTFSPRGLDSTSIPHNPFLLGQYAFVSYYQDGLQIYDLSNPSNPQQVGFYDTYPQESKKQFAGAWGCYPYLPSQKVLVSDMQTGLYIFDVSAAIPKLAVKAPKGLSGFALYPNPVEGKLKLLLPYQSFGELHVSIYNILGQQVFHLLRKVNSGQNPSLEVSLPSNFASGIYLLKASIGGQQFASRFTKR